MPDPTLDEVLTRTLDAGDNTALALVLVAKEIRAVHKIVDQLADDIRTLTENLQGRGAASAVVPLAHSPAEIANAVTVAINEAWSRWTQSFNEALAADREARAAITPARASKSARG